MTIQKKGFILAILLGLVIVWNVCDRNDTTRDAMTQKIDYELLKIKSYEYWDVYLHENQCYLGRVFVQLRDDAGVSDFLDISDEAQKEFFKVGKAIKEALKKLFSPDRMNYAALSNVSSTIHVHIIPRYQDPRIFHGLKFVDIRWGQNYAPYDKLFVLDQKMLLAIKESISEVLA